jgi:uncharacterized protein (TIGR00251 family)
MAAGAVGGGHDSPLRAAADGVTLAVRVTPRSSRNRIEGVGLGADGQPRLWVAVTAPPEDGKANDAVIALLAKTWKLRKRDIAVKIGATAREKLLHIAGVSDALMPALTERIAETDG